MLATVLAPGTSLAPTSAEAAYVAAHIVTWRLGWLLWIAAAVSLVAFFWWWAARLGWPAVARVALPLACAGVVADVTAESLLIISAPAAYVEVGGSALRLSGVGANGLYSVAGALLTVRTPALSRGLAAWTWTIWLAGAGLALAGLAGSDRASQVMTAVLFALFPPWLIVFGRRIG
ncbi:MAG TPA: hypothetical protein VF998_00840 [Candidatus Limnocylindria bacterium]